MVSILIRVELGVVGFVRLVKTKLVHLEKTFPAIPNVPLVLCVRVETS